MTVYLVLFVVDTVEGAAGLACRIELAGTEQKWAKPSLPEDLAEVIRRELGLPAHAIHPLPDPVTAAPPGARFWAR